MSQTSDQAASTWYETTSVPRPARPRLNFDLDVDVCVIGAGLAGLTVAREVAERGWSVAVLEAGRVADAASGRNTGFVLPGFGADIDDIVERVGLDHAKQLWALSERGLDYVRRTIVDTDMPGTDPMPGWLHISKTDNDRAVRADIERLRWIGADVEYWSKDRVREVLPNPRYFGAAHYRSAFHIHPLNYALGLAALAEKAGVRIFEDTPALEIDPAGVRKRIVTPDGRLRAPHVVLAGNVQLGGLMPRLAATLLPVSTFVVVTEPLGPQLDEVIRYRGAVSDTNRADNHYRIVDGNRLQWSGRMRTWDAEPRRIGRSLVADIRRNFPSLGKVDIAHVWRGTLGRTVHRMPQIGEIERGVWVAGGFGGHGLNTTAMAGELIGRGIVDADQTWRLFAPYELVWAGGRPGRAFAQAVYWGSRPVEAVAGMVARQRERARTRKQARLASRRAPVAAP
ncbi:FAD-binding oxidoreductase [Pseudolabrys taiwanensis]|uniref:FAD-binding oxidoreductase n=1 Tax=Pseudolabrys taiwanensis TaxID=331696 RepID=A0A345ZQG5_9HYPH|nr:FAD-dependent oxidoreductase [Pseudolabrys taiwanensis]AXK79162.1 FAD-binding oxidoreductase [Pseudolabrys taiwanensis]